MTSFARIALSVISLQAIILAQVAERPSAVYASLAELQSLARTGDSNAQFRLGLLYDEGRGVPQNRAEAARLYRLAADQGNDQAQLFLGLSYTGGDGVPQSYSEAIKWYRRSAEQGNGDAYYQLGYLYNEGKGVPQSRGEAIRYYRRAGANGRVDGYCVADLLTQKEANAVERKSIETAIAMAANHRTATREESNADYENQQFVKYAQGEAEQLRRLAAMKGMNCDKPTNNPLNNIGAGPSPRATAAPIAPASEQSVFAYELAHVITVEGDLGLSTDIPKDEDNSVKKMAEYVRVDVEEYLAAAREHFEKFKEGLPHPSSSGGARVWTSSVKPILSQGCSVLEFSDRTTFTCTLKDDVNRDHGTRGISPSLAEAKFAELVRAITVALPVGWKADNEPPFPDEVISKRFSSLNGMHGEVYVRYFDEKSDNIFVGTRKKYSVNFQIVAPR